MSIIEKANQVYKENFPNQTWFERAIFLSWYCNRNCKFCYMPIIRKNIKDKKAARRHINSISAEAYLCKELKWKIEFLSAGHGAFSNEELLDILKSVNKIYQEKLWLNVGVLSPKAIEVFQPYLKGICGSIETINEKVRKEICPDKPIQPILKMFDYAGDLEKAATIILGLGESIQDIEDLFSLIKGYKLNKIVFYPLIPHKDSRFNKGPTTDYLLEWIALTRIKFPKLKIVAGTHISRLHEIHLLLKAGANSITKFKAIKYFNTEYAREFENQVKLSNREFLSNLTNLPEIQTENEKLKRYLIEMSNNF